MIPSKLWVVYIYTCSIFKFPVHILSGFVTFYPHCSTFALVVAMFSHVSQRSWSLCYFILSPTISTCPTHFYQLITSFFLKPSFIPTSNLISSTLFLSALAPDSCIGVWNDGQSFQFVRHNLCQFKRMNVQQRDWPMSVNVQSSSTNWNIALCF